MNFIKKYYPMVVSILFVGIYSLIIGATVTENIYLLENDSSYMIILFILGLLFIIAIWVEIIGFIVHAAKNNNGIWALWIYLFNVFIIPYYNLKYVIKEKEVAVQMTVFVCLLILSIVGGISISLVCR